MHTVEQLLYDQTANVFSIKLQDALQEVLEMNREMINSAGMDIGMLGYVLGNAVASVLLEYIRQETNSAMGTPMDPEELLQLTMAKVHMQLGFRNKLVTLGDPVAFAKATALDSTNHQ